MSQAINLLFVCARNQWRSPTGEAIYRRDPRVNARSAGVAGSARRKLTIAGLNWADMILVMSDDQAARVRKLARNMTRKPDLYNLDIPDDYHFMDPELVDIMKDKVEAILIN